jgi:hypothetical protein
MSFLGHFEQLNITSAVVRSQREFSTPTPQFLRCVQTLKGESNLSEFFKDAKAMRLLCIIGG